MAEYIQSARPDEKDVIKEPVFGKAVFIQQDLCPGCKFKNLHSGCETMNIAFVEEGGKAYISSLADEEFRANVQSQAPCLNQEIESKI